jgi:hypothetical protein
MDRFGWIIGLDRPRWTAVEHDERGAHGKETKMNMKALRVGTALLCLLSAYPGLGIAADLVEIQKIQAELTSQQLIEELTYNVHQEVAFAKLHIIEHQPPTMAELDDMSHNLRRTFLLLQAATVGGSKLSPQEVSIVNRLDQERIYIPGIGGVGFSAIEQYINHEKTAATAREAEKKSSGKSRQNGSRTSGKGQS